jgi:hypothetical protein
MANRDIMYLTNRRHFEHFPDILPKRRQTKARVLGYTYRESDSDTDDKGEVSGHINSYKPIQQATHFISRLVKFDHHVLNETEEAAHHVNAKLNT